METESSFDDWCRKLLPGRGRLENSINWNEKHLIVRRVGGETSHNAEVVDWVSYYGFCSGSPEAKWHLGIFLDCLGALYYSMIIVFQMTVVMFLTRATHLATTYSQFQNRPSSTLCHSAIHPVIKPAEQHRASWGFGTPSNPRYSPAFRVSELLSCVCPSTRPQRHSYILQWLLISRRTWIHVVCYNVIKKLRVLSA